MLILMKPNISHDDKIMSVEAINTVPVDETMIEIDETEYNVSKNELISLNVVSEETLDTETELGDSVDSSGLSEVT